VEQFGGIVVFLIGSVVIIALFTAYLVWYGRWVGRRWWKKAERDNAPNEQGAGRSRL